MPDRDRPAYDETEWGRRVAQEIIDEYADAAAIDTASYRVCGFVEAAARLALLDMNFAKLIGASMEPPREMDR